MIDSDATSPVVGELLEITPDGIARGWCFSQLDPGSRRVIAMVACGRILATAICNEPSERLLEAGVGDGAYGFSVQIVVEALPQAERAVEIAIEDLETGQMVGQPMRFSFAPPIAATAHTLRAMLDKVADDGWITGWCWDQDGTDRRIRLAVIVDGNLVGTTTADTYRPDLAAAGIGDGAHAFSYLLPWDAISSKPAVEITLKDADFDQVLPVTTVFRRPEIVSIDDRLHVVERQLRLAGARVDDMQRRAAQDAERLGGIFRTIGAFFQRLAETEHGVIATALVPSLANLLEGVSARRPTLTLDVPRDPLMTLCIDADGTVDGVYDCLAALHDATVDRLAEIVLVDRGQSESAVLISAVVQNLRIWRVLPGQSVQKARNQLVMWAGRDFAGFLSSATRVSEVWIRSVLATFEREPACGAVCAKLVREDGLIASSALLPGIRGEIADFAEAEPGDLPRCDHRRAVVAATDRALIVRGRTFAALDGFDPSIADSAMATADLCLRLWDAGATVLYQPVGHVGWDPSALAQLPQEPARLASDWSRLGLAAARRAVMPGALGRALTIHGDGDTGATRDVVRFCAGLIEAGLDVAFAWPDLAFRPGAQTDRLRSMGVEVWRSSYYPSVAGALRNAPEPFRCIFIDRAAAKILSSQMIRGVARNATLILLASDPIELGEDARLPAPNSGPADWLAAADQIWLLAPVPEGVGFGHIADKVYPLTADWAIGDPSLAPSLGSEKEWATAFGAALHSLLATDADRAHVG